MKRLSLYAGLIAALLLAGCAPQGNGSSVPAEPITQGAGTHEPDTDVVFVAQSVRTNGYDAARRYPVITTVTSTEALAAYYAANKDAYDLQSRADASGFADIIQAYDDAFFESSCLVLIVLEESSGSVRHTVTDIVYDAGKAAIHIEKKAPQIGTDDMAQWHIIIELPLSVANTDFEVVTQGGSKPKK